MQPLRWDDLQTFLAVARTGQLARAAHTAGVDATTVGRRLKRLEATLAQTLFETTRTGQVLTEAGERLLIHAETMQRGADGIVGGEGQPGQLTGLLRISASEGFGAWFLADRLPAFTALHPGLTIDLVASSGFLNPSRRETDIAVVLGRPKAGPVVSRQLSAYSLHLYASRSYLGSNGTPASAAALNDHQLIGYVPDMIYAPELRYLSELVPGLEPSVRSSSILAQYRLIAAGAGMGVLPSFIGDLDRDLVRVLPAHRIERHFWLVTHQDTRNLLRVRTFVDWLVSVVTKDRARLLGE